MILSLNSNNLLTGMEEFSRIACLDGRGMGVITACEECSLNFNTCIRRRLLENLISNQEEVERILGYNLTPRYHEEEIVWDGTSNRIQLNWPGVVEMNVIEDFNIIDAMYDISPFVIEDAPITDSGSTYVIVELDGTLISNPRYAVIRNSLSNHTYQQQHIDNYPRKDGDGNWLVALEKTPPFGTFSVNVQHCNKMRLTIETPECDGDLVAVYPDTDDIIPFSDPPVVDGDNTTYWFYSWSMVDPDFSDEIVDLESAEFYKLITQVQFACITSTESLPVVTTIENCSEGLAEHDDLIIVESIYGRSSTIRVRASTESCECKFPLKMKVYYKTDPFAVDGVTEGSLLAVQEAIAWLTAAELPMLSCGCPLPEKGGGFIAESQRVYGDARVNPFSGETIFNVRYRSLHGQLKFYEKMSKAFQSRKLVRV